MRLWRKCCQIPGFYGQLKGDRGQPGSSQGSHRNTTPNEQEKNTAPHRQVRRAKSGRSALFYSVCPSPKEQKPIYYVSRTLADVENQIFKDGTNGLSSSKCRPETPPLFPSPPGGHSN
ncbi:hypothetical protein CK203_071401 [Vitis vinifera]|uniref:Uncharacterized protein n=1 Tax=Vitis vinifera TaxID=29760 RepID=A0A438F3N4_VITVI|nr:hypothetical protein CK203_071401 [Vitis vinifera]